MKLLVIDFLLLLNIVVKGWFWFERTFVELGEWDLKWWRWKRLQAKPVITRYADEMFSRGQDILSVSQAKPKTYSLISWRTTTKVKTKWGRRKKEKRNQRILDRTSTEALTSILVSLPFVMFLSLSLSLFLLFHFDSWILWQRREGSCCCCCYTRFFSLVEKLFSKNDNRRRENIGRPGRITRQV